MSEPAFRIEEPVFEADTARFTFALGDLRFTETLQFPPGFDDGAPRSGALRKLLELAALVLGTSYFKLRAPSRIETARPRHGTPVERIRLCGGSM